MGKSKSRMNALWNCKNPNQGSFERVLCVCSAGLLRSPTIAYVLSLNGFNTRAAGVHDYALIEVDLVLVDWADIVVFADKHHLDVLPEFLKTRLEGKQIFVLDIPDIYQFRDPELMEIITDKLYEVGLLDAKD
jgi:predicted protein tyrosine phosphatase